MTQLPKVSHQKEFFSKFPQINKETINGKIKTKPQDFKVYEVLNKKKKPGSGIEEMRQNNDPSIYFLVEKRELTSDRAKRELSKLDFIKTSNIGYAGMKDKYAVTQQYFSIPKEKIEKTESLKNLPYKKDKMSILEIRSGDKLKLGDLIGNKFEIRIRGTSVNINTLRSIKEGSELPNYYGSQRFGTIRSMNHLVGEELLKKNYKKAAKIFLGTYSEETNDHEKEARKTFWKTENPERALKIFPNHLWYEKRMLESLNKNQNSSNGNHWKKAFESLPRRIIKTFLHSFQSYIYNKLIAERIKLGIGLKRVKTGDIICAIEERKGYLVPERRKTIIVTKNILERAQEKVNNKEALITAPIPGNRMRKAEGEIRQIEEKILPDLSIFNNKPFGINLRGGRRGLTMNYQNLKYRKENENLIIEFFLPKGTYATVFLREFIGNDLLGSR